MTKQKDNNSIRPADREKIEKALRLNGAAFVECCAIVDEIEAGNPEAPTWAELEKRFKTIAELWDALGVRCGRRAEGLAGQSK